MGAGHGIGIKRDDFRRRNRKANISMHKHKHGLNKPNPNVRIIKYRETIYTPYVEAWNEQEDERWAQYLEQFRLEDEEDELLWAGALSSLERQCLIYQPPFLPKEEIRRRRFESGLDNNDHWWEWEKEGSCVVRKPTSFEVQ